MPLADENASTPHKPNPVASSYGNATVAENGMAGNAAHTTSSPNMAQAQHTGPKPGRGGNDASPINQHPVVDHITHAPVAHQYAPGAAGLDGTQAPAGGYTHVGGVAVNQAGSEITPGPKDNSPAPAVSTQTDSSSDDSGLMQITHDDSDGNKGTHHGSGNGHRGDHGGAVSSGAVFVSSSDDEGGKHQGLGVATDGVGATDNTGAEYSGGKPGGNAGLSLLQKARKFSFKINRTKGQIDDLEAQESQLRAAMSASSDPTEQQQFAVQLDSINAQQERMSDRLEHKTEKLNKVENQMASAGSNANEQGLHAVAVGGNGNGNQGNGQGNGGGEGNRPGQGGGNGHAHFAAPVDGPHAVAVGPNHNNQVNGDGNNGGNPTAQAQAALQDNGSTGGRPIAAALNGNGNGGGNALPGASGPEGGRPQFAAPQNEPPRSANQVPEVTNTGRPHAVAVGNGNGNQGNGNGGGNGQAHLVGPIDGPHAVAVGNGGGNGGNGNGNRNEDRHDTDGPRMMGGPVGGGGRNDSLPTNPTKIVGLGGGGGGTGAGRPGRR